MVRHKLPMELIADNKSRFRIFRNREKGLKKKLYELSTLCDVKACMIVYGPDGDGPSSSQPQFWPENRSEVECIIDKYMKERKEDRGKRALNLSDVLEIRKKRAAREPPKLQEEIAKKKRRTLEGGVDEFSYEELMAIIGKMDKKLDEVENVAILGKLDKKLDEVDNIIDFKKGETNSMNEPTVHCSHMKSLSAIQPLDIFEPVNCSRQTLEDGVDEFSYEELMEIIGELEDKHDEVENTSDFKKGETNSMNEPMVHCSHMKSLSAIQPLDIFEPVNCSRQTLEDGVDEFSYEELMEIIGELEDKHDKVENTTDFKKGETNLMNEPSVHLSAIQPLNINVPMDYSGQTLEDGEDEFSYEELMEIIGKLDEKHDEVESTTDFKKGETNSMNEPTVHCSHMQGLSAIQPLDSYVPMNPQGALWRMEWMSCPTKN